MRLQVRLGVTAEERSYPQVIVVGADLFIPYTDAMCDDNIVGTVDYEVVVTALQARAASGEWSLVERCGLDLARTILDVSPLIERTRVRLWKNALVASRGVHATVSLSRASSLR